MNKSMGLLAAAAVVGLSGAAEAHTLRIECKKLTAQDVVCRGLFSDGEVGRNMTVQLIDENDKLLATGKTDVKGEYAFKIPAPEYNVVITASKSEIASISGEDIW